MLYHQRGKYRQISDKWDTLIGDKIVNHPDVGAAPTTSSFSTKYLASMYCSARRLQDETRNNIRYVICCNLYYMFDSI